MHSCPGATRALALYNPTSRGNNKRQTMARSFHKALFMFPPHLAITTLAARHGAVLVPSPLTTKGDKNAKAAKKTSLLLQSAYAKRPSRIPSLHGADKQRVSKKWCVLRRHQFRGLLLRPVSRRKKPPTPPLLPPWCCENPQKVHGVHGTAEGSMVRATAPPQSCVASMYPAALGRT